MQTVLFFAIPILFGISVFLFAVSLIPNKSSLTEALELLRTRETVDRDSPDYPWFDRLVTGERRVWLARRLI